MTEREMVAQFAEAAYKAGQENRKMLDDEINRAVARKLGWKQKQMKRTTLTQHDDECIYYVKSRIPDYCRSIAAAWEIIGKVEYLELRKTRNGFIASMFEDGKSEGSGCEADTAPMAICLAFLKLG